MRYCYQGNINWSTNFFSWLFNFYGHLYFFSGFYGFDCTSLSPEKRIGELKYTSKYWYYDHKNLHITHKKKMGLFMLGSV